MQKLIKPTSVTYTNFVRGPFLQVPKIGHRMQWSFSTDPPPLNPPHSSRAANGLHPTLSSFTSIERCEIKIHSRRRRYLLERSFYNCELVLETWFINRQRIFIFSSPQPDQHHAILKNNTIGVTIFQKQSLNGKCAAIQTRKVGRFFSHTLDETYLRCEYFTSNTNNFVSYHNWFSTS